MLACPLLLLMVPMVCSSIMRGTRVLAIDATTLAEPDDFLAIKARSGVELLMYEASPAARKMPGRKTTLQIAHSRRLGEAVWRPRSEFALAITAGRLGPRQTAARCFPSLRISSSWFPEMTAFRATFRASGAVAGSQPKQSESPYAQPLAWFRESGTVGRPLGTRNRQSAALKVATEQPRHFREGQRTSRPAWARRGDVDGVARVAKCKIGASSQAPAKRGVDT
ncbi:hypothetical protein LX36DRAFT_704387 [Colletotrichum falcatum]|nr:hypothetical protein LX36DRAFT_704387 [Colletotrichum falcatum]